ncbi:MAG: 30S ribosomal protein S2 [Deltaproteobacteria bacterium]|nr:30S ribosomal protein S2 [Deltaproteobacteria bacterium]
MVEGPMKQMLEAGAHFGHQKGRWNPKMKPYIFGVRGGIHIIDLQKTVPMAHEACQFISRTVAHGGEILFVGTKKQAQEIVEAGAKRCGAFYVNNRWLGGTLTNFKTIKSSIDRLKEMEKKRDEGKLEGLTKKEKLWIEREIIKLTKALGGIKEMNKVPSCLFVVDPKKEHIALMEAKRLNIPVVALADTNCDPDGIDYLIPANDDALKAIRYFVERVAEACQEGHEQRDQVLRSKITQEMEDKAGKKETVIGGRGVAYVSKPDEYEEEAKGTFSSEGASPEGDSPKGESHNGVSPTGEVK